MKRHYQRNINQLPSATRRRRHSTDIAQNSQGSTSQSAVPPDATFSGSDEIFQDHEFEFHLMPRNRRIPATSPATTRSRARAQSLDQRQLDEQRDENNEEVQTFHTPNARGANPFQGEQLPRSPAPVSNVNTDQPADTVENNPALPLDPHEDLSSIPEFNPDSEARINELLGLINDRTIRNGRRLETLNRSIEASEARENAIQAQLAENRALITANADRISRIRHVNRIQAERIGALADTAPTASALNPAPQVNFVLE